MENEYMSRGYLLPKGCKDLTPVGKPKLKLEVLSQYLSKAYAAKIFKPLPPVTRQIFVSSKMTVRELAALLGQKPMQIICDLGQFGMFTALDDLLEFPVISDVARMHGFLAIRSAVG